MEETRKFLFVCDDDHANVSYEYAKALEENGCFARAVKFQKHLFCYPKQAEVLTDFGVLTKYVSEATDIIFMHTQPINIPVCVFDKRKRFFVFHGGSAYRNDPKLANKLFLDSPIIGENLRFLIQNYDLYFLDDSIDKRIVFTCLEPKEYDQFLPSNSKQNSFLTVAHYPRGVQKGTEDIEEVIKSLSQDYNNFIYVTWGTKNKILSWSDYMRTIAKCDIYVHSLPFQYVDKVITGLCVTAMEACALGKVVVTPFEYLENYKRDFKNTPPFFIANDKDQLRKVLKHLLGLSFQEISELKKKARMWVEEYHSRKPTGEYLLKCMM